MDTQDEIITRSAEVLRQEIQTVFNNLLVWISMSANRRGAYPVVIATYRKIYEGNKTNIRK